MVIFLKLLKWLGILVLILLALALLLLLIVLFVPFRYKAAAKVDDPESHSEFPLEVFRDRSNVIAEITWLFGIIKLLVSYPHGELISVKVFGKDLKIMDRLKKKEPEEKEEEKEEEQEEEEEEESSLCDKAEKAIDRIERLFDAIDYLYRVLTGTCGRKAFDKIQKCLSGIILDVLPTRWSFDGTVGLSDPCMNGRMTGACAVLMPVCDDHLSIETQWEDYRFDLKAEMEGKLRLAVPVKEAISLVLDKNCRKLFKKVMKARAKFSSKPPEEELQAA